MPLFVCFYIIYALYFSFSHSVLSLCNVEECRCARKNYLCFYDVHTVYAIYAVTNVKVHVKYVKDTSKISDIHVCLPQYCCTVKIVV